jgi:hypothetical protein
MYVYSLLPNVRLKFKLTQNDKIAFDTALQSSLLPVIAQEVLR